MELIHQQDQAQQQFSALEQCSRYVDGARCPRAFSMVAADLVLLYFFHHTGLVAIILACNSGSLGTTDVM